MTQFANFDDEHVPVPASHVPRLHAYQAHGGLRRGTRLIVSEHADREAAQLDGAFIAADETEPVRR